mgnify:FL=1
MSKNKDKTIIEVSDEGIIFADNLLADFQALDKFLDTTECIFEFDSIHAYDSVMVGLSEYLFDKEPTVIIHEKLSLKEEQYNLYKSLNNL